MKLWQALFVAALTLSLVKLDRAFVDDPYWVGFLAFVLMFFAAGLVWKVAERLIGDGA